jgi:hypothetical protein
MRTAAGRLGVAFAALLVAGCGSSSTTQSGSSAALLRLHDAVRRTQAGGTVHFVISTDQQGGQLSGTTSTGTSTRSLMIGDEVFASSAARFTTTTSGPVSSPTSTESIYVDGNEFVHLGSSPQWTEFPKSRPFSVLAAAQLRALSHASEAAIVSPRTTISGSSVTEYQIPIAGLSVKPKASATPSGATSGPDLTSAPSTLYVWLDGSGRVVRTDIRFVQTYSDDRQPMTVHVVSTLSEFGAPVHISAPKDALPAPRNLNR